ncbi:MULTISPECIES: hypothetical protein [unclassified Streptomyces]|uniref:hypothetical protein n=1 Tax=unclassified Streptomyces TaxID=2593676 RepID=UPI0033DE908B
MDSTMSTRFPPFVIDDSACDSEAAIWFAEPCGYTVLPLEGLLSAPPLTEGGGLRAALAPVLEGVPDELVRQRLVAQADAGQQLLAALCGVGTVYCAIGLHHDDSDDGDGSDDSGDECSLPVGDGPRSGPLLSFLTLSWRAIAAAAPAVTAAQAVSGGGEVAHSQVEYIEAVGGVGGTPVSLSETIRTPAPGSGLAPHPLLQLHAHLPHPDGRRLAVLTLSTTAVERRDAYRTILRGMVQLISFESPLEQARAH